MIQIKEEKIAELMFDIWHKSNDLKNPVMVGKYIAEEITKVKNLAIHNVVKRLPIGTEVSLVESEEMSYYSNRKTKITGYTTYLDKQAYITELQGIFLIEDFVR